MLPVSRVIKEPLLICSLVVLSLSLATNADELLGARCHTNCLHQLETRAFGDAELKRHLKHHIINVCKEDANCSSCTAVCQESTIDLDGCQEYICEGVKETEACKQSCEYLRQIYGNKPGSCSNNSHFVPSNECTAMCHLDGDCPEARKCCAVGCSRQCLKPHGKDRRLLPIPTSVTVQERKRRRSVIVRWVIQQMSRTQMDTNSNLYVLQWRWSVHKDGAAMSDWQTIMTRNKMYAILKHLLAPGRYYMFRVAAVNTHGSLGFSRSSQPFKLSKEPRAPGPPRDLKLDNLEMDERNFWKQRVKWNPPLSELPIKNYVLSWQKSTEKQAAAYEELLKRRSSVEKQGKRSTLNEEDEENENEDSFLERERMSLVVPPYHSFADIEQLVPATVYLVEVHATVDSSDGELHGEKGIIYVRTGESNESESNNSSGSSISTMRSSTTTTQTGFEPQPENEGYMDTRTDVEMGKLNIRTPYFDEDNLKAVISWFSKDGLCVEKRNDYIIRWRLMHCRAKGEQQLTYYDLDRSGEDWAEMRTQECVAVLEDLDFACSYNVELINSNNGQVLAVGNFETQRCEKTASTKALACDDSRSPDGLFCIVNSTSGSVQCTWKDVNEAAKSSLPIGYRVVLSGPTKEDNKIVINSPQATTVHFDKLEPDRDYGVHVQTITSSGVGNTLSTTFRTSRSRSDRPDLDHGNHGDHGLAHISSLITDRNGNAASRVNPSPGREKIDGSLYNNERFPGAAVLELSLESSASSDVRWIAQSSICMTVLFRCVFFNFTLRI